jgi:hypothetical protein
MRLLLVLVLALLFPTAALAQAPGTESVAGAINRDECVAATGFCLSERFVVGAADSEPLLPEGDSGFMRFDYSQNNPEFTASFEGNVTCLNVVGNFAQFSGDITRSEGLPPTGADKFFVQALDGGHPAAGLSPDAATVGFGTGAIDPVNCTLVGGANFFPAVNEHGNLVVRDDVE